MYRYLAIAWNRLNTSGAELAQALRGHLQRSQSGWSVVHDARGLLIVHREKERGLCRAYDLPGVGIILGRLFQQGVVREIDHSVVDCLAEEGRKIGRLGGECLAKRYWGRYVAFIRGEEGVLHLIRDPTGAMPVYYCRLALVDLIFSHMEDCLTALERPLAIDWDHLRAYLKFNRVVSAETGYRDVQQVLAGEAVTFQGKHTARSFCWHPLPFAEAAAKTPDDFEHAKSELRAAVRESVQAWASCHRRILLELSGGLDSSIVLACLASAQNKPETLCFNLYTEGLEGDERALARSVARLYGCELVETVFRPASRYRLEELLVVANLASPQLATIRTESEEAKRRLAAERRVEAIYSGQGGDHLFHRRRSALSAAEFVQRYGFGLGCWTVLLDTARMAEQPLTSVVAAVLRFGVFRRRYEPYAALSPPPFISRAAENPFDHPWVRDAPHLPAAKRQQIADLLETQCFYAAPCSYADIVHPLISQPVIECCLRLATYMLTHGGMERALARAAFSNELPREIVERTAKGDATAYYHQFILQNLSAIRELLLDGWLVRERLLHRTLTEQTLDESALMDSYVEPYVLAAMMAEAWVRGAHSAH